MAALTARRYSKFKVFSNIELPGTAQQVYQGGVACFNTATGLVAKAAASATMIPIGYFAETQLVGAGDTVLIQLFRELKAAWMLNSVADPCDTAGVLVYLEDDQTVRKTDGANSCSIAGRAWKIDPRLGVLVEMRLSNGDRLGGLDAA